MCVCVRVCVLGDCHTHKKRIVLCHYLPWPYGRDDPKDSPSLGLYLVFFATVTNKFGWKEMKITFVCCLLNVESSVRSLLLLLLGCSFVSSSRQLKLKTEAPHTVEALKFCNLQTCLLFEIHIHVQLVF